MPVHCRGQRARSAARATLECGIVLGHQRDPVISRSLDELLAEAEFVIEPVTEHHARLARRPTRLGRGSGHRAGLNFGDCLSYALALDTREPLLWKETITGIRALRPRSPGTRDPMALNLHRRSAPTASRSRVTPPGSRCRRSGWSGGLASRDLHGDPLPGAGVEELKRVRGRPAGACRPIAPAP